MHPKTVGPIQASPILELRPVDAGLCTVPKSGRWVYESYKLIPRLIHKLAYLSEGMLKDMRMMRDNCYGELGIL